MTSSNANNMENQDKKDSVERRTKILKWIDDSEDDSDRKPIWLKGEKENFLKRNFTSNKRTKQHDYKNYLLTHLQARYAEIETDFKTLFPDYAYQKDKQKKLDDVLATAEQIVRLLDSARFLLSKPDFGKQDLFLATKHLDLAEENLVWVESDDLLKTEIPNLYSRLNETTSLNDEDKKRYKDILGKLDKLEDPSKYTPSSQPDHNENNENRANDYRAKLADVFWICNIKKLEEMINNGLQIERLRHFRKWGAILFVFLLIVSPMVVNYGIFKQWSSPGNNGNNSTIYNIINATGKQAVGNLSIGGWHIDDRTIPSWHIGKLIGYWLQTILVWIAALSFAIIGGTGGYLSGLLQTRRSKTNLALYEENVLLSQLRMVFGAIAALVVFALLSWKLLSGILNDSLGPYVLTAFLSGFSERYFINLLKIELDEGTQGPKKKDNGTKVEPPKTDDTKTDDTKTDDTKTDDTKTDDTKTDTT